MKNAYIIFFAFVLPCQAESVDDVKQPFTLLNAIDTAIEHNTNLLIAKAQIDTQEGTLQVARSFFDPSITANLSGSRDTNFDLRDLGSISGYEGDVDYSAQYGLTLNKPLLLGGNIAFDIQMLREEPIFTGTNVLGYQSEVGVSLNLALLRGGGVDFNSSQIRQSEMEVKATENDLVHAISSVIRDVTQFYWFYLSKLKILDIQENAVKRTQQQLDDTQRLVDRDERPRSDLEQIKALLATRKGDLALLKQAKQRAQQDLAILLGIPFQQFNRLEYLADDFPETQLVDLSEELKLVEMAKDMRWDLQAMHDRIKGSKILLDAAKNGMLPRFDLSLFVGYRGLDVGGSNESAAITAFGERVTGPNASVGLTYEWNFQRNRARGNIVSANAIYQQGLYQRDFLIRSISSEVSLAWNALKRFEIQLNYALSALQSVRLALANEQVKLSRGMATVLDTIVLENQLIDAEKNTIAIQTQFANAIVELRFQSGLLIEQVTDTVRVSLNTVTTPPSVHP